MTDLRRPTAPTDPAIIERARALILAGKGMTETAAALGTNRVTLFRWLGSVRDVRAGKPGRATQPAPPPDNVVPIRRGPEPAAKIELPLGDLPVGLTADQLRALCSHIEEAACSVTTAAILAGVAPHQVMGWMRDAELAWAKGQDGGPAGVVALAIHGALASYDRRIGEALTAKAERGDPRAIKLAMQRRAEAAPKINTDKVRDGRLEVKGFADQVRRHALAMAAPPPTVEGGGSASG